MSNISKYLQEEWGFKLSPCYIPKNKFQLFKSDLFLFFPRFTKLLIKLSPIKYMDQRPDGSIWLKNDKIEIEIVPIPTNILYHDKHVLDCWSRNRNSTFGNKNLFVKIPSYYYYENVKLVSIYYTKNYNHWDVAELLIFEDYPNIINNILNKIEELKIQRRNIKLNKIL